MTRRGVLPDTCAWIEYFKPHPSGMKNAIEELLMEGSVHTCGPVLYEIVQGVKSEKEKAAVIEAFDSLEYADITRDVWIRAGNLASKLRSEGKTVPFSDVLIASVALEHDLAVLTVDRHFASIPGLTLCDF